MKQRIQPYLILVSLTCFTALAVLADTPDFAAITDVAKRKQAFIDFMVPHIRTANDEVWDTRLEILAMRDMPVLSADQKARLLQLGKSYGVPKPMTIDDHYYRALLRRVDIVPAALILAQAANESGWGTSRFAIEGKNYFGMWCYRPGCGIAPKRRKAGATHEVRRFASEADSVRAYIRNLNTHAAFRELHEARELARKKGENPVSIKLANGLGRYSERRNGYVEEIKSMIQQNQLHIYTLHRTPDIGE